MPSHQERREPLPKGYQFPTPVHVHEIAQFDVIRYQGVCRCGARYNADQPDHQWFMPTIANHG